MIRMERSLISEFEGTVETVLELLTEETIGDAASIIALYSDIRGYGPVKDTAVNKNRALIKARLERIGSATRQAA
jgi:indolepyruvate ferredoxin oxidoreductase